MTLDVAAITRVGGSSTVRLWVQVGFWTITAMLLLLLAGVQFGPAATLSILTVTITASTPITFGALTGICSERTGVVNIGIEGLLLTSAFFGFMVGVYTHNPVLALAAAMLSSAVVAL